MVVTRVRLKLKWITQVHVEILPRANNWAKRELNFSFGAEVLNEIQ